jgi:hypothetical protein
MMEVVEDSMVAVLSLKFVLFDHGGNEMISWKGMGGDVVEMCGHLA